MTALLLTLAGLAFLDSVNVLNIGVVSAVIYGSRLNRQSALPGGMSFIAGVLAVTTTFGLCAVLGLGLLIKVLFPAFVAGPLLVVWWQARRSGSGSLGTLAWRPFATNRPVNMISAMAAGGASIYDDRKRHG